MAFDSISRADVVRMEAAHRLPFRKDIEGLRAVAILLVVCAHAGVPWLAGGFVGVDVFFVLSGYLITGLLVDERQRTGGILLQAFYARRFQRLMPGLLLMIACTAIAAMVVLAPIEQGGQARAATAAATWTSNLLFTFQHLDYFGDAAETNLFLHTWSLGVEEQFYLLWPAIVLLAIARARRADALAPGMAPGTHRLGRTLEVIVVLAFVASLAATYSDPRFAFYMMPARSWQFALGGLVAVSMGRASDPRRNAIIGWAGLVAICLAALLLDALTPYPGMWALLPTLGTVAILVAGHGAPPGGHGPGVGTLLSTRPFQAIGKRSYAWYLWHWPVLLLGTAYIGAPGPWQVAALVALSLGLAWLSYRLVENPLRRSQALRQQPRIVLLAGIMLMLAALPLSASWQQWADGHARGPAQARYFAIRQSRPVTYSMGCDEWFHSDRVQLCDFGPPSAPHVAVLMGDSIAAQWLPAMRRIYNQPGWRVLVITKSACPLVDEPFVYARIGRVYHECETWRKHAAAFVRALQPDVLLLSAHFGYPYSREQWIDGSRRFIAGIQDGNANTRVGILRSTPEFPYDIPLCLARKGWRNAAIGAGDDCGMGDRDPRDPVTFAALSQVAATMPRTWMIDMSPWICPRARCLGEQAGVIAFRDEKHLSATFAASLATPLWTMLKPLGLAPAAAPASRPAVQAAQPRTAP